MHSTTEIKTFNLNLEIEDLESKMRPCCGSSTTSPLCTCPIFLTDCCAMVELADA
jgi:hypothetical protein